MSNFSKKNDAKQMGIDIVMKKQRTPTINWFPYKTPFSRKII